MAKVYFLLFLISFNVVLAKYSKEDSEEDSKEFNEDKEFKCPEPNGMFPHPDCTKFYLCVSDKPIVMDCPAGLHWNDKTKSCDWPQNVGCLSTDKPNQSTTTPKPEMTTITEKTTTDETIIDETTTYETTTETEDMMNETELNTETTTFSPNFTCPTEDGLFAHDDCWMYWECANGIAYERECADGTAWDDLMKICDWPANIISNVKCYIPDSNPEICIEANAYYQDKNDCRYFYHCDLSYRAHRQQCPQNLYFNEDKSICDFPQNVFCYDGSNRPQRFKRNTFNRIG